MQHRSNKLYIVADYYDEYSVIILLINWVYAFFRGVANMSALSLILSRNIWTTIGQTLVGNNG